VADINVERKGPSVWPWVIGLVVLALVIWALVEMFGDRTGPAVTGPAADTLMIDSPMVTPAPAPGTAPVPSPAAPDVGPPTPP
jgi:hypothetical protein